MTAPPEVWGVTESARLTARLIVLDGHHMSHTGLDKAELRACVELAHEHQVYRSTVAQRIGWRADRLRKWCLDRGIAYSEKDYPPDPMAWLNRQFNRDLARAGRFTRARGQGR
jgi:hypothetical protein